MANYIKRASLVTVTSTYKEYVDTLISTINAITKHLFLTKCQANFLSQERIPEGK